MFDHLDQFRAYRILRNVALIDGGEASDLLQRAEHAQGKSIPLLTVDEDDVIENIAYITFTGDGYTINLN